MKPTPLRKIFFSVFFLSLTHLAFSQYWQQQVNFIIDVRLNDKTNELDGFEKITYINNSPDTLKFIWFHLWPNAYKNDQTAFSHQLLKNGSTKFYFSSKEEKGYINRLDFKVDGSSAKTEDHPNHIDIVKLVLPRPLPPSQQITITTPFHVKLPFNFSRGGYNEQAYQITQWHPKPAVYDHKGWHEIPYLDQGEFYSEFGNYDVRITLPENYVVAATGELYGEDGKTVQEKNYRQLELNPEKQKKTKSAALNTVVKKEIFPASSATTKTLSFKQDNVHDFAWFADKRFLVDRDTVLLSTGKVVNVYNYYLTKFRDEKTYKNPGIDFAKDAIRFYSNEVGEYPYNIVSVVEGPLSFDGGMEYPTITCIAPMASTKLFDIVIAHEIGHNWFYGILASNERKHPWMDEGINSFYEKKYSAFKYGDQPQLQEILLHTKMIQKTDQPIETPSDSLSVLNYFTVTYHKTAKWMQFLEEQYGKDEFQKKMQEYFKQWKFKHPYPEDFQKAITGKTDSNDRLFVHLVNEGLLPNQTLAGNSFLSPFKKNSFKNYLQHPTKNAVIISPAIGGNSYDKLMIGALITNYKLPPSKFQFLLAPLYATGSKGLNGIGKLSYYIYSDKKIRATEFFLNGANFSMNQFTDSSGKKYFTQFQKIVPGIKVTFKEKGPLSTVKKFVQWKTFFIGDEGFRFGTDTIFSGSGDTSYAEAISIKKESRVVNQLQFVYQNTRALYPFDINVTVDQVEDLIRPTITANYFFNYPKKGGLQVRLFAGKIFYTNGRNLLKTFSTDRYHLNMTGANGYEDYTYSNYFLGRNKFEGLASQQIMMRDGGFKFRTDLLGDKVGKTDRWLAALNFSTTVPEKINPLLVLPIKIPLRIFADVGTYAEAWDRNQEGDRFLFDAGLQISLLKETVNIYIPIVYSKVYSDYYKSYLSEKRFLKNISFSINLNASYLKKLHHEVDF